MADTLRDVKVELQCKSSSNEGLVAEIKNLLAPLEANIYLIESREVKNCGAEVKR